MRIKAGKNEEFTRWAAVEFGRALPPGACICRTHNVLLEKAFELVCEHATPLVAVEPPSASTELSTIKAVDVTVTWKENIRKTPYKVAEEMWPAALATVGLHR